MDIKRNQLDTDEDFDIFDFSNVPVVLDTDSKLYIKHVVYGDYIEQVKYHNPLPVWSWIFTPKKTQRVASTVDDDLKPEKLIQSVQRSRMSIRRLLLANWSEYSDSPSFWTFTFKDNLKDVSIANRHFSKFIMRLRYFMQNRDHSHNECKTNETHNESFATNGIKYLNVIEFQKRGAVHYHCVFFNVSLQDISHAQMSELWGHGFCFFSFDDGVRSQEKVACYISKYITKRNFDKRLYSKKTYMCSRGLKRPQTIYNDFDYLPDNVKLEKVHQYDVAGATVVRYKKIV